MKHRFLLMISSSALLLFVLILLFYYPRFNKGTLYIDSSLRKLYLDKQSICINGYDKDGTTFFFLPSYISISHISQADSPLKLYNTDGTLLTDIDTQSVLDIYVSDGKEEMLPWRIAFMKSENLYTMNVYLDSVSTDEVTRDNYENMCVSLFSPTGRKVFTDSCAQLKGRGNSTWEGTPKKSYDIRLSKNPSLCGMAKSDKWCLLANYFDDTKILDKLAMDASDDIGMEYYIESDWIDLYINDDYVGNYLLTKEPDIDTTSWDIGNLQKTNTPFFKNAKHIETSDIRGWQYDTENIDISGGYLVSKVYQFQYNRKPAGFAVSDNYFSIKSPNNASEKEVQYIQAFFDTVDKSIMTSDLKTQFIDTYSFTRRYLINEFIHDSDTAISSYFFYKKRGDDILYAGPCWDYDMPSYYEPDAISQLDTVDDTLVWDGMLLSYPPYREEFCQLFCQYEPVLIKLIETRIDEYADKISASLEMDRVRWNSNDDGHLDFYSEMSSKYRFLKYYLYNRLLALASFCGGKANIPAMDFSTDDLHTITFLQEGHILSTMIVPDGTHISPSSLPEYDESKYKGWCYQNEDHAFSYEIPVYDDMELVLVSRD